MVTRYAKIVGLSLLMAGVSFGAAKLDISTTLFDFGVIPQNGKVSHAFVIRSTGTDSLRITNVKPGCGCTKAPLSKEVIAPGDSTELEIIFTSSPSYRGESQKTTSVTCNDDERGTFSVRFKAKFNVAPDSAQPLQLSPWNVDWPLADRAKEVTIAARNVSTQPVQISIVDMPRGFLTATAPTAAIAPGASAPIKLKVDPQFRGDSFEKSITIECSDSAKTRFSVPIVLGKPTAQATK